MPSSTFDIHLIPSKCFKQHLTSTSSTPPTSSTIRFKLTCEYPNINTIHIVQLLCQIEFITRYGVYCKLSSLSHLLVGWLRNGSRFTYNYHRTSSPITSFTLELSINQSNNQSNNRTNDDTYHVTHQSDLIYIPPHADINPWGSVDVIAELDEQIQSPSCGLYLLNILPNHSIPLHVHHIMSEAEMCLSDRMLCQHQPTRYGAIHEWQTRPHCYHNPLHDTEVSVLCIDSPVFIPSDEVLVDENQKCVPESCYIAGHHMFNQSINQSNNQTINTEPSISSITFDGAYPNQICELYFDSNQHVERGDAVLFFLFDQTNQLCFVNHRLRGLELIGGKVESNETEIEAVLREANEEANLTLTIDDVEHLSRIAQYRLHDSHDNTRPHIKSVYIARLSSSYLLPHTQTFTHETSSVRWLVPPSFQSILDTQMQSNNEHATQSNHRQNSNHDNNQANHQASYPSNQSINQSISHSINDKFSMLLCDHVYPLCCRVAESVLGK